MWAALTASTRPGNPKLLPRQTEQSTLKGAVTCILLAACGFEGVGVAGILQRTESLKSELS